ncbi:MAG: antiterminator Q family protein [Pseudomonadota bacterium]
MARIEWVKTYLENWARWKAREESGGLGFPSRSSFLRETTSGYREAIIPIDDCDASVTNDAIESLRPGRVHLYDCLYMIYIHDTGIRGAAQASGKAESTIKAQLDQADHAISAWFAERAERKKSFTT